LRAVLGDSIPLRRNIGGRQGLGKGDSAGEDAEPGGWSHSGLAGFGWIAGPGAGLDASAIREPEHAPTPRAARAWFDKSRKPGELELVESAPLNRRSRRGTRFGSGHEKVCWSRTSGTTPQPARLTSRRPAAATAVIPSNLARFGRLRPLSLAIRAYRHARRDCASQAASAPGSAKRCQPNGTLNVGDS
jgi:hypothetical protein